MSLQPGSGAWNRWHTFWIRPRAAHVGRQMRSRRWQELVSWTLSSNGGSVLQEPLPGCLDEKLARKAVVPCDEDLRLN